MWPCLTCLSSTHTGSGKWHLGTNGASCDQACNAQGMSCQASAMFGANAKIAAKEDYWRVMLSAGYKYTGDNHKWGEADVVPCFVSSSNGYCLRTALDREPSTIKCAASFKDRTRLCWCSPKGAALPFFASFHSPAILPKAQNRQPPHRLEPCGFKVQKPRRFWVTNSMRPAGSKF